MTWRDRAACRGHDPNLWHPVTPGRPTADTRQAQAVCAECPVADDCRQHAITHGEQWGIWGGVLPWDLPSRRCPECGRPAQSGRARCGSHECDRAARNAQNRRWRARRREAS